MVKLMLREFHLNKLKKTKERAREWVNLEPNCHQPRREQQAELGTFVETTLRRDPGAGPKDAYDPSRTRPLCSPAPFPHYNSTAFPATSSSHVSQTPVILDCLLLPASSRLCRRRRTRSSIQNHVPQQLPKGYVQSG